MRKYKICFLISVLCFLFSVFCSLNYAKDKPAATQAIEAANVRLNQRVEELSRENAGLKEQNLRMQAEITGLNRDRDQVLDKLKIITEENSKLKEMIPYLQTGVLNMEEARRKLSAVSSQQSEKIKELEKEAQPVAKVKKDFNARLDEERKKLAAQNSRLQALQSEVRRLKSECQRVKASESRSTKKYESEIEKLNSKFKTQNSELSGSREDNDILLKEKSRLKKDLKETLTELADANKDLKRLKIEAADMHYNLGVIFQKQNQWDEAIREYEKVLEVKPDDKDSHFNLALIYDSAKFDRPKAISHYQEYLRIAPDSDDAARIKERVTSLGTENKIWGESGVKNIREKKGRW
jgi:tetratricopeptide (TPR) repeat protein